MRISDWSSDVCSSDLQGLGQPGRWPRALHAAQRLPVAAAARRRAGAREHRGAHLCGDRVGFPSKMSRVASVVAAEGAVAGVAVQPRELLRRHLQQGRVVAALEEGFRLARERSEERREGKEGVSTVSYRGWTFA